MKFSLIVATLGRKEEIIQLLESLTKQTIGTENFEIILIDQNTEIDLIPELELFNGTLNITHIKSDKPGLSLNRNIGLSIAKGTYICFPDDDCIYYPDTLSAAYHNLITSDCFSVLGAIRERKSLTDIFHKWPKKQKTVTTRNFLKLHSSITLFTKKNNLRFNEDLGAGRYFGSCEDNDYILQLITTHGNCRFFPDVEVWHPPPSISTTSKAKNYSYGLGYGAFFYIHRRNFTVMVTMITALTYHGLLAIFNLLIFDRTSSAKRLDSVISRVKGYYQYRKKLGAE